jgi:phosphoglycolate phosphatase
MFNLVIFDLDGTLCDTLQDIAANANRVLRRHKLTELPMETIKGHVGRGARELMRRCVEGTGVDLETVVREFMQVYGEHLVDHTKPYPGVSEGLARLRHVKKVIASNKPEELSVRIVQALGLAPHFLRVTGGDTFPRRKPDPQPIRELMRQFGGDTETTLLVGDSEVDAETARAAGVRFCAAAYGYTPRERLKDADWMCDSFAAVVKVAAGTEPPDIA